MKAPRLAPRPHLVRLVTPIESVSLGALVERGCQGDESALRALYDDHIQYLMALCLRVLRNHSDAEEVVQESFAVAFRKLSSLRTPEHFRAWLTAIAIRRAHRCGRRERFLRTLGLRAGDEVSLDLLANPSTPAAARHELQWLDNILRSFDERQRAAWLLRHVEAQELDAIAQACGCSLATVKRWIQKIDARVAKRREEER